jgi:phosphate transport system substrate-binding protein
MRILKSLAYAAVIGGGLAATAAVAQTTTISGAGATFPYPIYAKWADAYKKETGVSLNYQSIGSGAGIKQIQAKTVTFGATDAPLKGEQLEKDGLAQFPMVMGGVVPVVNLEGIKPGELVIDGPTFAKIYLGEVKTWDAPEIKALNPNAKLPSIAIAPVYRSDGSGTTFLFTDYLSKVSEPFKTKVGSATSVKWPVGIGGKGNEGVAATVGQTKGGIGYVEFAYAKVNKMAHMKMVNRNGKPVSPELASFQAAAAQADWASVPGFGVILTNQEGDAAWPITGATFILMHKKAEKPAEATAALNFFKWALEKGDKMAAELDYVPMPEAVVKKIEASFPQIVGPDGKPLVK